MKILVMTRWSVLLGALFQALAVQAAEVPAVSVLTEEEFLSEDVPVVLTGSRLAQPPSEVPASLTVITRDMIVASGVRTVLEVMRLVPGFQVGRHRELHAVTYHGQADIFSRRMQVLVDGRSVYNPGFGGVEWFDLPLILEDIERIEVIRGPNGVTYGANSFIGVINIITRSPALTLGTEWMADTDTEGYRSLYLRHGGTHKDWQYRFSYQASGGDGFREHRDGIFRRQFHWRGDYRPNIVDSLQISAGYLEGEIQIGRVSNDPLDPQRNEGNRSHYQHVRWKHIRSVDEEIILSLYHNYHRVDDTFDALLDLSFLVPGLVVAYPFSLNGYDDRINLEYQHSKRLGPTWRAVWGAEARLDRISGLHPNSYYGTEKVFHNDLHRLFSNFEWEPHPDWLVNLGAMVEHNELTGTDLSPRLAANYHLQPHHTLRAVASRATRTPSQLEYAGNAKVTLNLPPFGTLEDVFLLGNPNLEPERITSYELGYLYEMPNRRGNLDIKLFREEIRDVIASIEDKTATDIDGEIDPYFINEGYVNIQGIEAQLSLRIRSRDRLWLAYSYARTKGQQRERLGPGGGSGILDLSTATPQHTLALQYQHDFGSGLQGSLNYYRVSDMEWLDGGDATGGYKALDFRLAQSFRFPALRGTLEFVARDVLGDYFDYEEHFIHRPRVLVSLRLNLD